MARSAKSGRCEIMTPSGLELPAPRRTSNPDISGSATSMSMTSGERLFAASIALPPDSASPTTCTSVARRHSWASSQRTDCSLSTISSVMGRGFCGASFSGTGICSSEFRCERQEQLAAEEVVGAVAVCSTAGDDIRVDQRRILVEQIVGAGADLHDLVDIPRRLEVQIVERRDFGVDMVVSIERREMQRRIRAVVVL